VTDTLAATPYMVSVGMAITPPLSNTSQAAGKHSVILSSLYKRKIIHVQIFMRKNTGLNNFLKGGEIIPLFANSCNFKSHI